MTVDPATRAEYVKALAAVKVASLAKDQATAAYRVALAIALEAKARIFALDGKNTDALTAVAAALRAHAGTAKSDQ